jgi:hypothetical protein
MCDTGFSDGSFVEREDPGPGDTMTEGFVYRQHMYLCSRVLIIIFDASSLAFNLAEYSITFDH